MEPGTWIAIWIVLILLIVVIIWAFTPHKDIPSDPEEYARHARENFNQTPWQSMREDGDIEYWIEKAQKRIELATDLN